MELSRLLKFYEKKIGQEISSDDHFLLKYKTDKKNSVFKKEDFEALKKDLQEAAKLDFDENDIGPSELLHLYNQKVDKDYKKYALSVFFQDIRNEIQKSEKKDRQAQKTPIEKLIEEENALEKIEDERLKKYTQHPKYSEIFNLIHLSEIKTLDEKAINRFDNLLNSLPEDIVEGSLVDLVILAKYTTNENIEFAKEMINKNLPIDTLCSIISNTDFSKEKEALLKKTIQLLLNNNIENKDDSEGNNRVLYYKSEYIRDLFTTPETTRNFETFLNKHEKDFNSKTISKVFNICTCKNFDKALELLEYRNLKDISTDRIEEAASLKDKDYDVAKELFVNQEYDKMLTIRPLLKLEPEKREKIKDFVNSIDEHDFLWSLEDICDLNDNELEQLKELNKTEFNGKQITTFTATRLAKEPPEIIEKIKNYQSDDLNLPDNVILFMLTSNDTKLENFIKTHQDYHYEVNINKKTLDITIPKPKNAESSNTQFIRYNQFTKSFESSDELIETHSSEKIITNTNQRKIQNIEYTRIPSSYGFRQSLITRQDIKTFDPDNNLSKTETYELSPTTGYANITETDSDGNKKILQQASIDKLGNLKLTKNFESPNGTKTEYKMIEDELGNRRSIHRITDKNGKIILDRTSSLKMISENKFLSTRNGISFEIEYTNDEIVITNPENKKSTAISLKDKFLLGEEERILKLLKTMSAEQLLILKLSDINLFDIYSTNRTNENTNNGSWNLGDKTITIGDHTYSKNQREYMQRMRQVLSHEYGHYINDASEELLGTKISKKEDLATTFKREYLEFIKTATVEEETFIDYFSGTDNKNDNESGASERCAESNTIANGTSDKYLAMRGYYLEKNFPESIALNIKEVEKIELLALQKSGLL